MNLLEIYNLLERKEITEAEAAKAFGFSESQLRFRITKWGHKLPLLLATLDKIKADTITREEAAKVLDVEVRQVNKLQSSWNVNRPLKRYLVDRAKTQIKWELHKKFAIDFIGGGISLEEAAKSADVSVRQMRRWVSQLLMKHYDMPWKDLTKLSLSRQRRLADAIDHAENNEHAKLVLLQSISDGQLSMNEVALNRVLSKRSAMRGKGRRASDR